MIEPRNINLEVEQAWTALTLQEWQQAAVLTHDVVEREPQDPGVVRLNVRLMYIILQSFVSLAQQELMPKVQIVANMMST
nr:hypothetical protein HRS07_23515 [Escherichia coli]